MPQLVEYYNLPNPPFNASGVVFENATLRQTMFITQDADTIRLQFSNAYSISDLPITAVTVALPYTGEAGDSAIKTETLQAVTFAGGYSNFTVPDGSVVLSDPIAFPVKAQSILTVTMYLETGQTTNDVTGHPGSRTNSYYAPGNLVTAENITGSDMQSAAHWYFLSTIEGWLPWDSSALVVVGDSITDGRGSTTDGNDRWPDQLLARMQNDSTTKNIAVINEAAGGNRILYDGLGPNALGRIDFDVIAQSGVRYALVYEGVNDIGTAATDLATQESMGTRVIAAYEQMIVRLHRFGIAVFGATITPFSGPGQVYSDPNREAVRQKINAWIRDSGRFDGVVDFDAVVRDPNNATQLNPEYNFGDYLHMNPTGYKAMADAVDLTLFTKFAGGVWNIV